MQLRLTPTSFIVLGMLERLGEASPYDVKQEVARTVGNFWSVPHSQLYREGERLARGGHLAERRERTPGGRTRKLYSLTPTGRDALDEWRRAPAAELPELRDLGLLKLFFGAEAVPLARTRLEAHRRKLAEYEAMKASDPGRGPRGSWQTLEAGIGHEREWVRFWSRLGGRIAPRRRADDR